MAYVLKLDPRSRQPRALLRTRGGSVDRWDGEAWQETALTSMQLDGLGGDSDYYTIKQTDLAAWQKKLPAS